MDERLEGESGNARIPEGSEGFHMMDRAGDPRRVDTAGTWRLIPGTMTTPWTVTVDPSCPLPEYPRPYFERERWLNLNGLWDYAVVAEASGGSAGGKPACLKRTSQPDFITLSAMQQRFPQSWDGRILVPFCLEAGLSGVGRTLKPHEILWYRRTFRVPADWRGYRILLHFGAVDWEAAIWVNGKPAGTHRGGYLPFAFDITELCGPEENEILVSVADPTDTGFQARGKQSLKPHGILYTPVSGIWQTVWLEPVPVRRIEGADVTADPFTGEVRVFARVLGGARNNGGGEGSLRIRAEIRRSGDAKGLAPTAIEAVFPLNEAGDAIVDGGNERRAVGGGVTVGGETAAAAVRGSAAGKKAAGNPSSPGRHPEAVDTEDGVLLETIGTLMVPDPAPWSPGSPSMYDLTLLLVSDCAEVDQVRIPFAFRSFSVGDVDGMPRLLLNGEPLFQMGILDQGYWPDGLYTPPCEEAILFDLELVKRSGYNMIRKHIKVECQRWYHHCDRLGLIVWQDLPSGGAARDPFLAAVPPNLGIRLRDTGHGRLLGRPTEESRLLFIREAEETVRALRVVPCIGMWVPFNEGWGQFDARGVTERLRRIDPSRPFDHASGWYDQEAGDLLSRHVYFKPIRPPRSRRRDPRPWAVTEFGGYSHEVSEHVWPTGKPFGYRWFPTLSGLWEAWERLFREEIGPAIPEGLSAAVYTQLSDVEGELNGIVTYDRRVVKIDPRRAAELFDRISPIR